ncbi:TetR/AcrR family transcriptional regulator [Actinoplanes sp. NPDC049598]
MGLREEKKERTRRQIADTAWVLFADRGFEQVTVAEVAAEAGVSEATVFNYFASKEDLFFERLDRYGLSLVDGVASRPAAESPLAAFRRLLLTSGGLLARLDEDPRALDRLRTINRVIAGSPSLRAREQLSFARIAETLAASLPGDPVTAHVVAYSLVGVQRSLVQHVRTAILAGEIPDDLAARAEQAFTLLEHGLG